MGSMNYSKELKDALLRRMLPPNNESITKISKEEGISEQTLRNWRDKARRDGCAAPGTDALPDDWSTQDKFLVVVETASMNETELAEYARKKGLYVEQIKSWKDACLNANGGVAKEAARLNRELKDSEKERKSTCRSRSIINCHIKITVSFIKIKSSKELEPVIIGIIISSDIIKFIIKTFCFLTQDVFFCLIITIKGCTANLCFCCQTADCNGIEIINSHHFK